MADKANQKAPRERTPSQRDQPPSGEQIHGRERPMDDPGRGHGDILEDELSRDRDPGQRGD